MCGFAGFYTSRPFLADEGERILSAMGTVVARRGPDGGGLFYKEGLGLVHRRLAIVDLSLTGAQPMSTSDGHASLVFNGEIYNHKALRLRIEKEWGPMSWHGTSDTETLLVAIQCLGIERALQACVGMFALAYVDRREGRLFLCRDRFGEKPLYFATPTGAVVFGSDLNAVLQFPESRRKVNRAATEQYFRFGFVPGRASMVEGVSKVLPGELLIFDLRDLSVAPMTLTYWSAAKTAQDAKATPFRGSQDDAQSRFEELLKDAVRLQMDADVEVGAFLSGGLDSTLLACLMQEASGRPIKTFTIGFSDAGYNEAPQAASIARHLGTDHTEHIVSDHDIQDLIAQVPHCYDEPMSDASQIPTVLLSRLARRTVKVCISGDGGDEALGGYNRHLQARRMANLLTRFPKAGRSLLSAILKSVPARALNGMEMTMHQQGIKVVPHWVEKLDKVRAAMEAEDLPQIYAQLLTKLPDSPLISAASANRAKRPSTYSGLLSLLPDLDASLTPAEQMMVWDATTYLPADVLVKVDRASMAFGLETRAPFLDHRIYELLFALPEQFKIQRGLGKMPSRRFITRYVPPELVQKPKRGFAAPVGQWLAGPARDWAESLLSTSALSSSHLLDAPMIQTMWQQHLSREKDWQHQLWSVLVFQSWHQKLGNPPALAAAA